MTKGDARLTATQIYRILRQHLRQLTPFRRDSTDAWCIVFPDSKIAYLPIPKAANSSIRAELLRLLDIDPETVAHVQAFTGFDKRPFSECVKIMDEDWFFFTVVRNPFSRTVSAYMDKLDHHGEPFPALRRMGLFKGDSFARFLRVISLWPKVTLNNHFMPQEMLLPPGYLSLKSMMGVMKAKSSIGTKQTIDTVIEKGMFICGSPETVRSKLEEYQNEIGFGHLLTLLQFGTLPAELTRKNMEIYANEVMPYLRERVPAAEAAE
jgi:hypothetical protein